MAETLAPTTRIGALDLIRGVAVLGILAVNLPAFAGPMDAALSPNLPVPGTAADNASFGVIFVLFEGKMRALFTLLFGASMMLFVDRAEAAGRDGALLQLRRLGWLALFGYAHFIVLWPGDILLPYALVGMAALAMHRLPTPAQLTAAALLFAAWHLAGALGDWPAVAAEEAVRRGTATAAQIAAHHDALAWITERMGGELAELRAGIADQAWQRLSQRPLQPLFAALANLGETLPLMLLGMALQRSGFFAGEWPRRWLWLIAAAGTAIGAALTLALLGWLAPRGFPPQAMRSAVLYWTAPMHLLMALGYAAALVLAAPRLARTAIGARLTAAGRMAFSNYLGTTVVMTALFHGWGLGLAGRFGHAGQLWFLALGWALMLAWSEPWLARFRQGPLEWLWRSLTEGRVLPLRRRPA